MSLDYNRSLVSSLVFLAVLLLQLNAYAQSKLNLEEVLAIAEKNSTAFRAIESKIKSLELEIKARDLVLSASLSGEISGVNVEQDNIDSLEDFNDNRDPSGKYALFDSLYLKPFDSGTQLALGVSHDLGDSSLKNFDENEADWEIRVSQSLWRDAFGKGTDLRRRAEKFEYSSRYLEAIKERQDILVEIELAYWDLLQAEKEVSIQKANLDRSRKLLEWMKGRVSKFAAEDVDQLQVETLLSERELDLSIAKDNRDTAISRLQQLIPEVDPKTWSLNLKELESPRALLSIVDRSAVVDNALEPELITVAASSARVRQLEIEAERVEDSLSPDLAAFVSYGANGSNDGFYDAWAGGIEGDSNAARVGLTFSVQLDFDLKKDRIDAAKYAAESEKYRYTAQGLESQEGWKDLNRKILSLNTQISEARRLNNLQHSKVEAEKLRFEQGRSTTFQMVSFEIDANESDLRLFRLLTNLRKLEAQARTYILAD